MSVSSRDGGDMLVLLTYKMDSDLATLNLPTNLSTQVLGTGRI